MQIEPGYSSESSHHSSPPTPLGRRNGFQNKIMKKKIAKKKVSSTVFFPRIFPGTKIQTFF